MRTASVRYCPNSSTTEEGTFVSNLIPALLPFDQTTRPVAWQFAR